MFRRAVTGVGALVVLGLMASGRAPVGVASGEPSLAVAAVVIALALGAALAVRFLGAELESRVGLDGSRVWRRWFTRSVCRCVVDGCCR